MKPSPKSPTQIPTRKLHTKYLEEAQGTEVVLYLVNNGVPLKGVLLEFDDETVVISPHTNILRKTIVAFYQAKDAPKKVPRPPVR